MRHTHHNFFIALTFILTSHLAIGQGKDSKDSDFEKYTAADFTIKYPSDWKVDESGTMGTKVIFFSPLESADDQFSENINIMTQDLTASPMTLKEYTDLSVKQINTLVTNGKIIESTTMQTPSGEGQRLVYTMDQGQYHLQFEQLYVIKKDKVYLVTYTAETTSYQKYLSKASHALESFILK